MKMKTIGALPWPSWRWILCALAVGVAVALTAPTLAQSISGGNRYNTTPVRVDNVTFDSTSLMWGKSTISPRIISLNSTTDQLTQWTHANASVFGNGRGPIGVQAVAADPDGFIWAGFSNGDHINRLNTTNGQVTSWPVTPGSTCGDSVAIDASGNAWFGKSNSRVARLNPSTNNITEWTSPTTGTFCASVIEVDTGTGEVWFCEDSASVNKIGKLNPNTDVVTEWTIPGNFNDCHARDAAGQLWFSRNTTEILRLNPGTDELKVWACPQGCGNVQGVSKESSGKVWFAESGRIGSLDTTTNAFVQYAGTLCSPTTPFIDPAGNVWTTRSILTVCTFSPP